MQHEENSEVRRHFVASNKDLNTIENTSSSQSEDLPQFWLCEKKYSVGFAPKMQ
jgi:hypothetical protein